MQYDSSMHDSGWCSDNQTILRPSLLNSVTKRKEKKRKEKKRKEKKRKEKKVLRRSLSTFLATPQVQTAVQEAHMQTLD